MKRFLVACAAVAALLAVADQKASAWTKFNFNVGLNMSYETADTNLLWGLFRSGPHPFAQQGQDPYGYGGYWNGGHANAGQGGANYGYYPYFTAPTTTPPATLPAPGQSAPAQSPASNQTSQIGYFYYPQTAGYSYSVPYYWYDN